MSNFRITEFTTEYQIRPLGIEEQCPRFAWKMHTTAKNCVQKAYRIRVGKKPGGQELWDTGVVSSADSTEVSYQGLALQPVTRYYVTLQIWNTAGEEAAQTDEWFETGLMNPSQEAWEGAQWIGAPEKYVCTETVGVFVINARIRLQEGSRQAGIVFGANDPRLMDARKNQYEISGENYIRYVVDVEKLPATLSIYRVGYHPDDCADRPMAVIPIVDYENPGRQIITERDRYQEHILRIEVMGNNAYTYVDGILVDAVDKQTPWGTERIPRQLNPLGDNDTTTFPRLCELGYYVGAGDTAYFNEISVYNDREPKRRILTWDEEDMPICVIGVDDEGHPGEQQYTANLSKHAIPMFRRDFSVRENQQVQTARLYITARGIYVCRINGGEITDTWFNPGDTQYDKHIMYQTYDITDCIQAGTNGIAVTLASGWWCDAQTYVVSNYNYYGDRESFLAKLVVEYSDGSRDCFVTNPQEWFYYGDGPYRYAGFFQGEHLDGRRVQMYEEFSKPGYTVLDIKRPVVIVPEVIPGRYTAPAAFGRSWPTLDHRDTQIVGGYHAPIREVCRVSAQSMTQPREGLYIYDLGQEIAGVPSICFHGSAGTEVTIRYGEMLYPDLPEYGNLKGLMLTENYRDAESIDKYILRGDEDGEIYIPRFTFHGYRYIEISGIEQPPALREVDSIQLSSVETITGHLETSDPLLNRFLENVRWSQLCNFISIPTDCPQRNERMGWAGDTHVFCRAATYQSDSRLFYYRYLEALKDLQEESGQLPCIAPAGGGFGGITYESAMIIIVWELYQQYGDIGVIRKYYDTMQKWIRHIRGKGMPGEAQVGPLGDWLSTEDTDLHLLWNAFYGYDLELMGKMARALRRMEDAERYAVLREEAVAYWNQRFVDPETGKTRDGDGQIVDSQCSYALPLAYHMFDDRYVKQAQEHLARKTVELGHTIGTGFFGTGVLNPMLTEGGHVEDAYQLMLQTAYPSWLYPVTQGATTIWERWNSYTVERGFGGNNNMNSFNHYSLGSVITWIYETVLGIKRDEAAPGYRHFILEPQIHSLRYAKGGFETAYGRIESAWKLDEQGIHYCCRIPDNTSATLRLRKPDGSKEEHILGSGEYFYDLGTDSRKVW